MIPFSLVTATRVELQEMEPFPRKRRMSDSGLLLKSADNTVKLPYQEWLRLQRMELTAAAGEKRRELLEKGLEKRSSPPSEPQTEEPGKKSRIKLLFVALRLLGRCSAV